MPRIIAQRLLAYECAADTEQLDWYMIFRKEKANVHDAASTDW